MVGPHPYPDMVARFQSVIGEETIQQLEKKKKTSPDYVIACVGGGSNAAGLFYPFLDNKNVKIMCVEAAGKGIGYWRERCNFSARKNWNYSRCKNTINAI